MPKYLLTQEGYRDLGEPEHQWFDDEACALEAAHKRRLSNYNIARREPDGRLVKIIQRSNLFLG